MANRSDFLLMHCTNTDAPQCAGCTRDMVIPISAVEGFYRNADHIIIEFTGVHFCANPACHGKTRHIRSDMAWDDLIALLDGEVSDMGNIAMTYIDRG